MLGCLAFLLAQIAAQRAMMQGSRTIRCTYPRSSKAELGTEGEHAGHQDFWLHMLKELEAHSLKPYHLAAIVSQEL